MRIKTLINTIVFLLLVGCAGLARDCSGCWATNVSSSWVVAQYTYDGTMMRCWVLRDSPIANEQSSDGIWWKDFETKHLVHISGWYNRVQVIDGRFKEAANLLGVDISKCLGLKEQ